LLLIGEDCVRTKTKIESKSNKKKAQLRSKFCSSFNILSELKEKLFMIKDHNVYYRLFITHRFMLAFDPGILNHFSSISVWYYQHKEVLTVKLNGQRDQILETSHIFEQ
jgi:hypothetical protein